MERPIVYTAGDACVQCKATERKLDQLGIEADVIPLEEVSPEQIQEWKDNDLKQAPIVEFAGERWSGFRPDKLGQIALKMANELPS